MRLADDEVHLWYCLPEALAEPAHVPALQSVLTPEELAQVARFHFERDRQQRLVTRALVRCLLSRYAAVAPARWRFVSGAHGRPEIAEPAVALRFNLSHTDGMIVCAVARAGLLGMDVESVRRRLAGLDIAERFFSPREVAALLALPAGREERFFDYWTLKEAYIKARGLGLALSLQSFSMLLPAQPGGAIAIAFAEGSDDTPEGWCFAQHRPHGDYLISTAMRLPVPGAVRFVLRGVAPLAAWLAGAE